MSDPTADPKNDKQPDEPKRDFGEPLDLEALLAMAEVDELDMIAAQMWWNENGDEEGKLE